MQSPCQKTGKLFIMTGMLQEIPVYILIMMDCIQTVMKRRQSQTQNLSKTEEAGDED